MPNFLLFFLVGIGMQELLILLLIILVLFGGSRLPSLAKGLGESVRNFKHGMADDADERDEKKDKNDKTRAA